MRKLLMAAYHFPPSAASASFRLLGFSRHLPKFGWTCDVVAPPVTPWEAYDEALGRRVPPTTTVFDVPFPRSYFARRLTALLGYSIWLPAARAKMRKLIATGDYDAVLTSGPPHVVHQLGLDAKRRGMPWVADFRDPWSGLATADWVAQPRQWGDRRITKRDPRTFPQADALIANAPKIADLFREHFPEAASKVTYITNGYDPEDFATEGDAPAATADLNAPVTILHSGGVYAGRNPVPVMEAAGILARSGDGRKYMARFVGWIDPKVFDIHKEIADRGLAEAVEAKGRVPYDEILREMRGSDILLLLDTPGRKYGLPAKLYEYIGAGRPILALGEKDSDLEWALQESGVPYRVVGYESADAVAQAIRELAALRGEPCHRTDAFKRDRLAGELARVLDGVVDAKKSNA